MDVISKEVLSSLKIGSSLSGILLMSNYETKQTKGGKPYFTGEITNKISVSFKCWDSSDAFKQLKAYNFVGKVVAITASIQDYSGQPSVVLTGITAVEGYTPDQFVIDRYPVEQYWEMFKTTLYGALSDKGKQVADMFFTPEVIERFKIEYAASYWHDNCKGGLLAHSYRMLCLSIWVSQAYPETLKNIDIENGELIDSADRRDLLFLGVAMHDIGKIDELELGVYTTNSFVTHRFFGAEKVTENKAKLVELYGDSWYYALISVMLQHHGEFDDECRTVSAYIVHLLDMLDCSLTGLKQRIESERIVSQNSITVKADDFRLTVI